MKVLKSKIKNIFSTCTSVLTFGVGVQKNHIVEMVLLSTHNICFGGEIRILFFDY